MRGLVLLFFAGLCILAGHAGHIADPKAVHNLEECKTSLNPNSQPYLKSINRSGSVVPPVVTETLTFPERGEILPNTITCIRVIDTTRDGSGGYVRILEGGLNSRSVTLEFRSQPLKGYLFTVEIHRECKEPIKCLE